SGTERYHARHRSRAGCHHPRSGHRGATSRGLVRPMRGEPAEDIMTKQMAALAPAAILVAACAGEASPAATEEGSGGADTASVGPASPDGEMVSSESEELRAGGVRAGGVRMGGARVGGARAGGVRVGGARAGGVYAGGYRAGGVRVGGVRVAGAHATR